MFESLQNYRYIDNLNDLRDGSYIRWIHVTTEDEDLLLNTQFLDFNWQSKPAKNIDTIYTFDDVIGRAATVGKEYPSQELKIGDTKTPNNRAAHSIYIRPDKTETPRKFFDVLLKCHQDPEGLTPAEYLKEQEDLIRYIKMIIDDYMKNIVLAIENEKEKYKNKKDGEKNSEKRAHKEYLAAAEEFKNKLANRIEIVTAFESYSSSYYRALKRKDEILPEIKRIETDIILLDGLVRSGMGLKTPSLDEYAALFISSVKSIYSRKPTNAELLEANKVELKAYQDELYDLNKEISEVVGEVREGLMKIPLDTRISLEMGKVCYSLNKGAFMLKELDRLEQSDLSENTYTRLELKPMITRALTNDELVELEEISKKMYQIYEAVFLENEKYGVEQVNRFIIEANKKFSIYKNKILNRITMNIKSDEIRTQMEKLNASNNIEKAKLLENNRKMLAEMALMESLDKKNTLIDSSNNEKHSYIINSLMIIPDAMPSVTSLNSEEREIRGSSIENKLIVPDIQGFLNLLN
jgi:hypothetical protein